MALTATSIDGAASSVDQSDITQDHSLSTTITIGAPTVDQTRILGFAALSRVDIDGANAIVLTDSQTDVIMTDDSITTVTLDESYLYAEVA